MRGIAMNNTVFKPNLYTTGCPLCLRIKRLLTNINKKTNIITAIDKIQYTAKTNNICSLPILEYKEGQYLGGQDVENYIRREWFK